MKERIVEKEKELDSVTWISKLDKVDFPLFVFGTLLAPIQSRSRRFIENSKSICRP